MNLSKCLVIDLELSNNEIIEIGVGCIDFKKQLLSRFNSWLIKPIFPISEEIQNLTGITNESIKQNGKRIQDVWNTIRKNYSSSIPYSGWGNDHYPLSLMLNPPSPFSAEYINWGHIFNFKWRSKQRVSLDSALNMYGLSFQGQRHRAKDDAYNCGRLALKIME